MKFLPSDKIVFRPLTLSPSDGTSACRSGGGCPRLSSFKNDFTSSSAAKFSDWADDKTILDQGGFQFFHNHFLVCSASNCYYNKTMAADLSDACLNPTRSFPLISLYLLSCLFYKSLWLKTREQISS